MPPPANRLSDADRLNIELIASGVNDDLTDHQYTVLFEYYSDLGEMPYGVQKARSGDPFEWITNRLAEEYNSGMIHDMLKNL